MNKDGATKTLAEFAVQLEFEKIPDNILKYLKLLFLDGIGCCIHGNTLEWTKTLKEVLKIPWKKEENSSIKEYID